MATRYLHTKLSVRDLDRAIAFYEASFGYRTRARRPGPDEREIAFLVLGDAPGDALGDAPGEAELQLAHHPGAVPPPGLVHLAFRVDDCAAAREACLAAGATALKGPYTLPSGSIVAFLRDPDGYDLELVQKPHRP